MIKCMHFANYLKIKRSHSQRVRPLLSILSYPNRATNESDSSRCDNTNNSDNSILYHSDYCVWSCTVEKEEKW